MNNLTHGMSIADVERLARTFGAEARVLADLIGEIDRRFRMAGWAGSDSDEFENTWGFHKRQLVVFVATLEEQELTLRRNIDDQRRTSERLDGGGFGGQGTGSNGHEVSGERGISPSVLGDIVVEERELDLEAMGHVWKVLQAGLGLRVIERRFADGHYELVVMGGLAFGLGLSAKQIGLEAGASRLAGMTFTFKNRDEMEEFQRGLAEAPMPDNVLEGALALRSPSAMAGLVATELASYVWDHRDSLKEVSYEESASGGLEVGGLEVSQERVTGVSYDLESGETTFSFSTDTNAGGTGSGGGMAGSVDAGSGIEVTIGPDGEIRSVVVDVTVGGGAGVGVSGDLDASLIAGKELAGKMEIDASNPAVQDAVKDLVAASARGDIGGMREALARLEDDSTLVLQERDSAAASVEIDATVASGEVEGSAWRASKTYVKEPGGTFREVRL